MIKIAALENNILAIVAGTFAATIAAEDIEPQFHALTHFPDRRARSELADLAERLNLFAAHVVELWNKACAPIPEAEIEAFARRHVDLTRRYWAAEGRCMNWFITGPARFPVARNEKRMRISDARRADLKAHEAMARKSAKRKAFPHGTDYEPIRSGDPVAMQRIVTRIEEVALSIDRMKAANAIIRRMVKDLSSEEDMIAAVVAHTGLPTDAAARGIKFASWQSRRGFSTTNSRAELRRLQQRLAALARMKERGNQSQEVETSAGAVEIKENADIARIQLIFPDKPDDPTRRVLKANGFRWSPRKALGNGT
ncbi:hypothetical protein J2Z31_005343 [Sinorhizobium kostiense]|uniref:Uncharacterized protein n=1 Tax=Sinorhizobium kostiense TaxID=76747 RepID=A0ABS4RAE4_9HYPH|nr:hypothetical protein [Sinorhizobium kostiense]MBP2238802.1 hypothetical protein [Sinorhizobium kostiense]